jgi:hypothetical protein
MTGYPSFKPNAEMLDARFAGKSGNTHMACCPGKLIVWVRIIVFLSNIHEFRPVIFKRILDLSSRR